VISDHRWLSIHDSYFRAFAEDGWNKFQGIADDAFWRSLSGRLQRSGPVPVTARPIQDGPRHWCGHGGTGTGRHRVRTRAFFAGEISATRQRARIDVHYLGEGAGGTHAFPLRLLARKL